MPLLLEIREASSALPGQQKYLITVSSIAPGPVLAVPAELIRIEALLLAGASCTPLHSVDFGRAPAYHVQEIAARSDFADEAEALLKAAGFSYDEAALLAVTLEEKLSRHERSKAPLN